MFKEQKMIQLIDSNKDSQQKNQQEIERKSSLCHIADFQSERIIDRSVQSQVFGHRSKLSSLDCIQIPNSPKKKFRQKLKQQDFISFTSTYMKRGTLDSDMLDQKNDDQLNEKDYIILEILKKKIVDVKQEEDSNVEFFKIQKKDFFFIAKMKEKACPILRFITYLLILQKDGNLHFKKGDKKSTRNTILKKSDRKHTPISKESRFIEELFKLNSNENQSFILQQESRSVYCLIPNKDYKSFESSEEQSLGQTQKEKTNSQQLEKQTDLLQQNKRKLIFGGQPFHFKRQKSQEQDLHEFDLESGTYEPPKSPLKKNKLLLKPNRSQSFSDQEEETDEMIKKRQKEENKKFIQQNYPEFDIIKELKQGDSFGEIAVLTGEKRTATLICSEDTHLLALSKKGFDTILGAYKQYIIQETVEFLRKIPFLQPIPSSQLMSLFQSIKEEKYVMGNYIYNEKDKPNYIYFVKSGEIEISKEIQQDDNNQNSDIDYQEYNKRGSISEVEKSKVFTIQKKKNKQRVRLYQLGPHQYFGEQEIMKKLPFRETQAKCNSQEAVIYSIEKKDFLVFMKVHKHFQIFKKEVQIKMDWEEERDKNLVSKSQQNKLMLRLSQTIHNKPQNLEDTRKSNDNFLSKYNVRDSDSNFFSQQYVKTSASLKSQRKINDKNALHAQPQNDSQPLNDYFNLPSNRYNQQQQQIPMNYADQIKNEQQQNIFNDNLQQKNLRNKLPTLQSNFIENRNAQKNYRSNSLNHLIYRQNKPIIEALVNLKNKGCDITQLSKLSADELKNISRIVHKSNIQIGQPLSKKGNTHRENLNDINEWDISNKYNNPDNLQQQQRQQFKNNSNSIQQSIFYSNYQDNQDDICSSKQSNISTQPHNQINKQQKSSSMRLIETDENTTTSSKKISMLLRKSFDYSNAGFNQIIQASQTQRGSFSPKNYGQIIEQRETPPKKINALFNSPQNHCQQKQQVASQTIQNDMGSYSIFNRNKPRSKTDQLTVLQRPKNINQPCKGSTLHIEKQVTPHYKFEEELIFKNNKQINKNKDYFDQDNNNRCATLYLLGKKSESKLGITSIQKFTQVENNSLNKPTDNQEQFNFKKSPRSNLNADKLKFLVKND